MSNKISLQKIADTLGISKVTVSRALKGQSGVSDALREDILARSRAMGYAIDSLRGNERAKTFTFITPSRFFLKTEHFYTDIYYYLHRLCDERRYALSLHIIDPEKEDALILPNQLLEFDIAGVFVGGELSKPYLGKIASLKKPTVVIDFFSPYAEFNHVTVDNFYLGYRAACYLLDKGHKAIGFVGRPNISSNVADRLLGVRKALGERGLVMRDEWIIENHNPRTGLYTLDFPLPDKLPSAFVSHCDRAGYFLIERLKRQGLSVPRDVSVLSFDDTETAKESVPPLTCLKIDRVSFAENAVRLMDERLGRSEGGPKRVYLESDLVERDSVRSFP